ncbi:hypothetical protein [Flexithrix dorotheae]|uniref:hypothetical protein n=1 Tax=Flexithrix dorotheae TaxID=70993 RepID=UPI000372C322|nr:hypothetical protein [Flexithrix dorotheae]
MNYRIKFLFIFILFLSISAKRGNSILVSDVRLVYSTVLGKHSDFKEITLSNNNTKEFEILSFQISGTNASSFKLREPETKILSRNNKAKIAVQFTPSKIGIEEARLTIEIQGEKPIEITLMGLGTKGLEGKNEPPLADALKVLGFKIDIGWTSLGNHTNPELIGEEISAQQFKKAKKGPVSIIPVARYSPDFILPFGYYLNNEENMPELKEIGILAKADEDGHEHQILYPRLEKGNQSFDPGKTIFGIYTTSPSHTAYTEDYWNEKLFPTHAIHAVRTYPLKDEAGKVIKNAYLICFEEAKNGDYQDYVFAIYNIVPVEK